MDGDILRISGPATLAGDVRIGGFKHLLVVAIAAALLGQGSVSLRNCPQILELRVLSDLLRGIGAKVSSTGDRLDIDCRSTQYGDLDPDLCQKIHGSVYLVPGLLSRFGRARLPLTGGCRIGATPGGARPMTHYVSVLRRFGATATLRDDTLEATADRLHGCDVDMAEFTSDPTAMTGPLYSGATKYAILCAAVAHGNSRILNPYPKLDVVELVEILRQMGSDIYYVSADEIAVYGRGPGVIEQDIDYELPADLIELVTWVSIAAITDGDVRIQGAGLDRAMDGLGPEKAIWQRMGVTARESGGMLAVARDPELSATSITAASRDIYSDSQPFFTLLATHAVGESIVREQVWTQRFDFADGLRRLGATIDRHGASLVIDGPCVPHRAEQRLCATDLRGAAVLLAAAMGVPGKTLVAGCTHLRRGYADLPGTLCRLGADIRPVPSGEA